MQWSGEKLAVLLNKQLNNFFMDVYSADHYRKSIEEALEKVKCSLGNIQNKYYEREGFSPYHTGQYSVFLYYLSNALWKSGQEESASQIYYLNKILNGVDWFYQIELPAVFFCEHPIGSVLGRAEFEEYFFVYQGTTVGGSGGYYPKLGNHVLMYSNSSILGSSVIGNYVIVASNTTVVNEKIPDYSLVFGQSPNLVIKTKDKNYIIKKTRDKWRYPDEILRSIEAENTIN